MSIRPFLALSFLLPFFLVGCYMRSGYLPKVNIAGPSLSGGQLRINDYKIADSTVIGTDSFPIIFIFPIMGENRDIPLGQISNAIENICKKNNYAFMTNVKVYAGGWYIPLIYGQITIKIEGEGWTKSQKAVIEKGLRELGYLDIGVMYE